VGKKKGGGGPKKSGVIKRTSVKVATSTKPKRQPGKKFKVARVTHKHHTKEALFEPETTTLALAAEE
jgi:hypothetical protein